MGVLDTETLMLIDAHIIIGQHGEQVIMTALLSSPEACQLISNMPYGTMCSGTRYLSEHECDAAFALIDAAHLTTRTFG